MRAGHPSSGCSLRPAGRAPGPGLPGRAPPPARTADTRGTARWSGCRTHSRHSWPPPRRPSTLGTPASRKGLLWPPLALGDPHCLRSAPGGCGGGTLGGPLPLMTWQSSPVRGLIPNALHGELPGLPLKAGRPLPAALSHWCLSSQGARGLTFPVRWPRGWSLAPGLWAVHHHTDHRAG